MAKFFALKMNRELFVNVTSTEINIALCEDRVLVELNREVAHTGFAVGDIYLGKCCAEEKRVVANKFRVALYLAGRDLGALCRNKRKIGILRVSEIFRIVIFVVSKCIASYESAGADRLKRGGKGDACKRRAFRKCTHGYCFYTV